jgi:hypothetical protein
VARHKVGRVKVTEITDAGLDRLRDAFTYRLVLAVSGGAEFRVHGTIITSLFEFKCKMNRCQFLTHGTTLTSD